MNGRASGGALDEMGAATPPRNSERRGVAAIAIRLLLGLLTVGLLAGSGWGVLSYGAPQRLPASEGEAVEVPGGLLRVERAVGEKMAPMQNGKFKDQGMNMSAAGMDMAPKGYRRFAVQVALAADAEELSYAPDDFRASAGGDEGSGPVRSQLGDGLVAPGSEVAGTLVFQVPEGKEQALLSFKDGTRPVSVRLGQAEGEHEHSRGEPKADGHGSDGEPPEHSGHEH